MARTRRCPIVFAHTLDVTAATLYEAIAQVLAALRAHEWVGGIGTGLTSVTVKVKQLEVTVFVRSPWYGVSERVPENRGQAVWLLRKSLGLNIWRRGRD